MATTRGYDIDSDLVAHDGPAEPPTSRDAGAGWVVFAAIMFGFAGIFAIVEGVVALSRSKFYAPNAVYVFSDLRTWGWIVLMLGIAALFAAALVVGGSQWARWFCVAMAAVNAFGQLMFVQAYPWWSVAMFTVDVLVVYALVVHAGKSYTEG